MEIIYTYYIIDKTPKFENKTIIERYISALEVL